jgi:hypothetical protein
MLARSLEPTGRLTEADAAAKILPSECRFVTFDDRQREAAEALGLKVLAPPA